MERPARLVNGKRGAGGAGGAARDPRGHGCPERVRRLWWGAPAGMGFGGGGCLWFEAALWWGSPVTVTSL